MSAFPAGFRFHYLAQVHSTNIYAMEQLYAGLADNGDVYITGHQLAGKGQRGKTWLSEPNQSVLMSIVVDTGRLSATETFRISAVAALAARSFLENLGCENVFIKWPNDLFIGDRKAGGILIENTIKDGALRCSIVGIGLNINQTAFADDLDRAVSVAMITGKQYDCEMLAKKLAACFEEYWEMLLAGKWPEIIAAYNTALYGRDQIKRLRRGSVVIPCLIKRVNSHGLLVAGENDEWHFEHGEVVWLP